MINYIYLLGFDKNGLLIEYLLGERFVFFYVVEVLVIGGNFSVIFLIYCIKLEGKWNNYMIKI